MTKIQVYSFVNNTQRIAIFHGELLLLPFCRTITNVASLQIKQVMRVQRANTKARIVGYNVFRPITDIRPERMIIPLKITYERHIGVNILDVKRTAPTGMPDYDIRLKFYLLLQGNKRPNDSLPVQNSFFHQFHIRVNSRSYFPRCLINGNIDIVHGIAVRFLRQKHHLMTRIGGKMGGNMNILRRKIRMQNQKIHGAFVLL